MGASGRVVTASSCLPAPCCSGGAALRLLSIGACQRLMPVRGQQGSESHSFWSTSEIPEDDLPWQCSPQPPPWHGVPVRRFTTRLLPASLMGCIQPPAVPTTSQAHFELLPSCIPLFQGSLAVGSVQQPWDRLCRQLPARVSLCGTVGGAADMDYISAKKDVLPSEMVSLEGGAAIQVCRNDF